MSFGSIHETTLIPEASGVDKDSEKTYNKDKGKTNG